MSEIKLKILNLSDSKQKEELVLTSADEQKGTHLFYLVTKYQQAAERAGTASCKNRSAVSGGGAKPYKQKGTGRARRGTNRTPLRRGGGVIFGPSPRSYYHKLNDKLVKKTVAQGLLSSKDKLIGVSASDDIKTKAVSSFLTKNGVDDQSSILFVLDPQTDEGFYKACRNLKNASICLVNNIPVNKLVCHESIVITESAGKRIKEILS